MELSIKTLRSRIDPFLTELGTLQYRHGAGLSPSLPLGEIHAEYPELSRAEAFQLVKETLGRPSLAEDAKPRARALWEFIATQVEEGFASEAIEEIATLESRGELSVANEAQLFRDAITSLPLVEGRVRRDLTEQAVGAFLLENLRPYARRHEAALEVARRLGFSSYLALREAVTGIDLRGLAAQCEEVLRKTEDAYRDVLAYALKKLDPELRPLPGNARRHDTLRVAVAPWLLEHFRHEELLSSVRRCVEEMGFHPSAHGRIQLDTEDRAGKCPRPFVADVKVPDDVRLVVRPGQGLDDYFALLHEYGHALHFAHTARTLSVEERRLGDASVREAWAYVFDHFLIDERWHRRFLGMSQPQARDAARVAALNNLLLLRRYCAKFLYELSLFERGPSRERADEYQERLSTALFVTVHKGFFLYDVDPQFYSARYLRAWALEPTLHGALQERFDQDHWRNPGAGRWLATLFERGQRDDAEALSKELSGAPLSLLAAGQRLVDVLNR